MTIAGRGKPTARAQKRRERLRGLFAYFQRQKRVIPEELDDLWPITRHRLGDVALPVLDAALMDPQQPGDIRLLEPELQPSFTQMLPERSRILRNGFNLYQIWRYGWDGAGQGEAAIWQRT